MNLRASIAVLALTTAALLAACTGGEGLPIARDAGAKGTGGGPAGTGGVEAGTGGLPIIGVGGRPGTGGTKGGIGGAAGTGGFTCGPICDIYCRWGNVIDAKGCPTCACNPPPACALDECPPPPPFAQPACDGGVVIPATCTRDDSGACGWIMPHCEVCPPLTCKPSGGCPSGFRPDSNGCLTCECAADCPSRHDASACQTDGLCIWLAPGCGMPALSSAGCYAPTDVGCKADTDCTGGRACLKRVVDPCYASACDACGITRTICL